MLIVAVCLGGVAVAHGLAFVGGRSCVVPHQCRRSFLSLSETPFADQARKVQALHERIKEGGNAAVPSSSRAAHNARQASTFDEASTFFASAEATPPEVVPAMQSIALSVADNLGEGARVLDVATGTGALLPFYEEQRVDLRRVVGVDLSGDMLAFARKRFPVSTFVQADFLDLEQEDVGGGFDAIVFNACFANLYDHAAAIRHAASLLNEGGRVFISHPLGSEFVRQLHASDPGVVPHVLPDEAALGEMAGRTSLTVASYCDGGTMGMDGESPLYLAVLTKSSAPLASAPAPSDQAAAVGTKRPQRVHVVVNPFGGGGRGLEALDAVKPVFESAGIEVVTLETEYAGHAGELARTTKLLDAFIGIGGDGTAHEIANGMLRRDESERVPIGIIPAGSGNTWAFDLGLDDAVSAAEAIVQGRTTNVDAMAVGPPGETDSVDEFAINICGYGMPAAVLAEANALRWLGSAQYELAGLLLIASGQTSFDADLQMELADGTTETRRLQGLSFAQAQINMHMGKRVPFAPDARMDDGLLDLVLVTRSGGLDILRANACARGATHGDLPFVEMHRCRAYTLTPTCTGSSAAATALNLDGELSGSAPFRATCVPGALEVYTRALREKPNDTSAELEPQIVLAVCDACEKMGLV